MEQQMTIFDFIYPTFKIKKPIRLIEFFAGYGSQNLALKYLGANYKHYKICEWATKSIQAYNDLHIRDYFNYSESLSFEKVVNFLYNKGISYDYNVPMTREQIQNRGEEWCRNVYNNIIATDNLVNIQQVHASNLNIYDTQNFTYVLTYSFPCQDLSISGKMQGMSKGSGTRSGLLWEVERILKECKEQSQKIENRMPQVLIMENVPQIHSQENVENFKSWIVELEKLGYTSYWEDLNAKDYGIPQNRNRTFMVSILGKFNYHFPAKQKLTSFLRDYLYKRVDEDYYLSPSKLEAISNWKAQQDPLKDIQYEKVICPTLTARGAGEEHSGMILINEKAIPREPKLLGGIGEMKSNGGQQFYFQDRIYDGEGIATAITTTINPNYFVDSRIRKLTPREAFRLMGLKDEDIDNISDHQTDTSLYHLSGDSIVVNVLMAIFKEML